MYLYRITLFHILNYEKNYRVNATKFASEDEKIATLSFVLLDKNKNKFWERREWKIFRDLVTGTRFVKYTLIISYIHTFCYYIIFNYNSFFWRFILMDPFSWIYCKIFFFFSFFRGLRKCGKKMPRYCDVNSDKKITLSEWLNCLQANRYIPEAIKSTASKL